MLDDGAMKSGDWVEVRPISEILATLDDRACLEAMPFMPEMVELCGSRFRIWKSAHKTCDPTGETNLRRVKEAVHGQARCTGAAHGGCEARCLIFWKKAWLKQVDGPDSGAEAAKEGDIDLGVISNGVRDHQLGASEIRFRCQATEILKASTPLPPFAVDQYVEDVTTGNVSATNAVIHVLTSAASKVFSLLNGVAVRRLSSVDALTQTGAIPKPEPLNLIPGEIVEVRAAPEIMRTLNKNWKNRGLVFEREMLKFCGRKFRVLGRVNRLIDEKTGRLLELKNDCVILEGLYCGGIEKRLRLFCPRAPYYYWREAWLRRAAARPQEKGDAA